MRVSSGSRNAYTYLWNRADNPFYESPHYLVNCSPGPKPRRTLQKPRRKAAMASDRLRSSTSVVTAERTFRPEPLSVRPARATRSSPLDRLSWRSSSRLSVRSVVASHPTVRSVVASRLSHGSSRSSFASASSWIALPSETSPIRIAANEARLAVAASLPRATRTSEPPSPASPTASPGADGVVDDGRIERSDHVPRFQPPAEARSNNRETYRTKGTYRMLLSSSP